MSTSDLAISVRGISKSYTITRNAERHDTLAETILHRLKDPFRRDERETFWALKDVSFDVKKGEIVGIIGRNGAGKSTLLKIMSRITEPTSGEIDVYGRIGSLLEVGTGFHPELSGRENIYLNGQILGMRRKEISCHFDAIIEFAGVEKFIDTPVKRYSSGMYVRLAFAVAAHLRPEILIVDEVLAVGDAAFQKKCLGKMGEVAKQGRTVIFVSHNMAAIENLCSRAILLRQGSVSFVGDTHTVIGKYLTSDGAPSPTLADRADRQGSGELKVHSIEFLNDKGEPIDRAISGQSLNICLHYHRPGLGDLKTVLVGIMASTLTDMPVFLHHNRLTRQDLGPLTHDGTIVCRIPRIALAAGSYNITYAVMPLWGSDGTYIDTISNATTLAVDAGDFYGTGELPLVTHGVALIDAVWSAR